MIRDFLSMDKRWARRRQAWVSPPDVFNPARYSVDVVDEKLAKAFVCENHYSGSYPAARLAVGLFGPGGLVGIAVFSVSMNQNVIPAYTTLSPKNGAELGRFVCDPSVRFNGESWFLARAFPFALRERGIQAVVSYADPLERPEIEKPAHWGTIYQASNATYAGRSSSETLLIAPNGAVVSRRSLAKVRRQERGNEYAARQLVHLGAPPRGFGECPEAWVARIHTSPGFRRVRHPGNLAYVFGLTAKARRLIQNRHAGGLPYPRKEIAA